MEEKVVFESSDEILIRQIIGLLEDNNIAYIRREVGSGAYMTILFGQSLATKQILVSEEDYDKAKKLLKVFEEAEYDIPEELKEEEE
mgnify:FL=1